MNVRWFVGIFVLGLIVFFGDKMVKGFLGNA